MKSLLPILGFAAMSFAQEYAWQLPKGFPKPHVPADNPMSAEKVELGRYLFYDVRMSLNGKTSCDLPPPGTRVYRRASRGGRHHWRKTYPEFDGACEHRLRGSV